MQTKLTSKDALNLLLQDIKEKRELSLPENRWILHSIYVGEASQRIAKAIGINSDKALIYGYLHDIGRRINHNNHPIEGYNYLMNLGYEDVARICLTHSFIDNEIEKTAGGGPKDLESYNSINSFLQNNPHTIYDNIIQLCDLFCLETGYTTIEKRLLDIANRKGIYDNSYNHFLSTMNLKSRIENGINCSLYDLFPEINQNDLHTQPEDYKQLKKMFIYNKTKRIEKI